MPAVQNTKNVAVLLPCYNEEQTLAQTIRQMRAALPGARIVVFDNNSKDASVAIARQEGAEVHSVPLQGKGNVVRRMFADIEADVYVMTDADTTYDPATAPLLVEAIASGTVDMAVAARKGKDSAFPPGHRFGNKLFNLIVAGLFGRGMIDIFSGYRAFSRRFAKSFPAHSAGFEIETELSVFALEQRVPFVEIPSPYGERPEGSASKLRTYRDGARIFWTILMMVKNLRPFFFFGAIAVGLGVFSLAIGVPVLVEWLDTGEVTRQASAVLCSALGLMGGLLFTAGLVLDSVARSYRESRHMFYLSQPSHESRER